MLAKAKAGRQAKIAADKTSGRAFVASEGYSSPADVGASLAHGLLLHSIRECPVAGIGRLDGGAVSSGSDAHPLCNSCSAAALQTAVNALSKTGSLLASGQLEEAKTVARCVSCEQGEHTCAVTRLLTYHARSGLWVVDLKRVLAAGPASLSGTADKALAGVASLQKAGALGAAKANYVTAVAALEEWTTVAGVANKLKGL